MRHSELPVVTVHGADYVPAAPEHEDSCEGCVAEHNALLCRSLPDCSGRTFTIIFKEAT